MLDLMAIENETFASDLLRFVRRTIPNNFGLFREFRDKVESSFRSFILVVMSGVELLYSISKNPK